MFVSLCIVDISNMSLCFDLDKKSLGQFPMPAQLAHHVSERDQPKKKIWTKPISWRLFNIVRYHQS